jgi:L-serine/L-threonine ammonia-lyase
MTGASGVSQAIHLRTPLLYSKPLSDRLERSVYLKLDCLQPSGSFKVRGVGFAVQKAISAGYSQLVSSSGGNAGLATAYCGSVLGIDTTVVLPETATQRVKSTIKELGAEVIVRGSQWVEANAFAESLVSESQGKALLIHPFDMPDLWEGHASLVQEIKEQMPEGVLPSLVLASVGGGGLLMGILRGLKDCDWHQSVPVLACETLGADALTQSLKAGSRVKLEKISSVAKSLGADRIGEDILKECMSRSGQKVLESIAVTDEEAVGSYLKFALDHNILVEPACGAALAPLYYHFDELEKSQNKRLDNLVVEVCGGGAFNSIESLAAYADQLGLDLNGDRLS